MRPAPESKTSDRFQEVKALLHLGLEKSEIMTELRLTDSDWRTCTHQLVRAVPVPTQQEKLTLLEKLLWQILEIYQEASLDYQRRLDPILDKLIQDYVSFRLD